MAQTGGLTQESFSCSICLDPLMDPVTIPCGHNYCKKCITTFWDGEDRRRIYSCPECRQRFIPRPVLVKNIMLAELVEQAKKTGLQAAAADHCYAGPEDVQDNVCSRHHRAKELFCRTDQQCICPDCVDEHRGHDTVSAAAQRRERQRELEGTRQEIQQTIQDTEKDEEVLQQEEEAIGRSVKKSEKMVTKMIRVMEERSSELMQQIKYQEETEVVRVQEAEEKLQQKKTELKRRDAELEQLSHTEDHVQFLNICHPSLLAPSRSTDSSRTNIRPRRDIEVMTAAMSELLINELLDVVREM